MAFKPSVVEWSCLACGLYMVFHYLGFQDDSFVFFRYVDNLVFLKVGLVYNIGEYVEGYSSPMWLMILILFRYAGMDYLSIMQFSSALSFLIFWALLVRLNLMMSPPGQNRLNFPLIFLTFNYGVANFFSSGMESPLVQVLAVCYALFIMTPESKPLQTALALSPLVRPEFAAPLALSIIWSWWDKNRIPAAMIAMAALFSGAWLAFRVYYYADIFPNTFYLLDTINVGQGLAYLHDTFATYGAYYILAVFTLFGLISVLKKVDISLPQRLMMLVLAASVGAYVVKIGGSYIHYRYLAFSFCLVVCSVCGLPEHFFRGLNPVVIPPVGRTTRSFARFFASTAALALAIAIACLSSSLYPPSLSGHPWDGSAQVGIVHEITDTLWGKQQLKKYLEHSEWMMLDNALNSAHNLTGDVSEASPYRRVLVDNWCENNYVNIMDDAINPLGLTDPVLARIEVPYSRPAHKWDLRPYAEDLMRIRSSSQKRDRGMYRQAVLDGKAPDWVVNNINSLETIEKKAYNHHDPYENFWLAFTFPRISSYFVD